ncbi:MAG: hypothetical protein LBD95_03990 [Clostridiales Family XIII bacterium]|nr:hypothetical protein [Clostridiales Family XIII bacterium]
MQFHENNVYAKEEAIKRLKIEKPFDQVLFHTERAVRFRRHAGCEAIGSTRTTVFTFSAGPRYRFDVGWSQNRGQVDDKGKAR